jgi:[ribosomal protein S18]-alanine N-acetyltransferase
VTPDHGITIRDASGADLPAVKEISDRSFSLRRDIPWFEKYLGDYFKVAVSERGICGFLIISGDLLCLIAVSPEMRHRDIATRLLEGALAGRKGLVLRVREENKGAIAFFRRIGFRRHSVLKSYYSNGDDAIEMHLENE